MQAQLLPQTYEELANDEILSRFLQEEGLHKIEQNLAVITDNQNTPIIYTLGTKPFTLGDWEPENYDIKSLLGRTLEESKALISFFVREPYAF